MRKLDNGDYVFPRRGQPPPDITNYTRDASDPFLFHANFQKCIHLTLASERSPCGRIRSRWLCKFFNKTTSVPVCQTCKERVEP